MKYIVLALIILLQASPAIAGKLELSAGKSVDLLMEGPLIFTKGLPTAWNLQYQTSLDMNDTAALTLEANEVWNKIRPKEGYKTIVFQAMSKPSGGIVQRRDSYGFVYENKNGVWHMLEPGKTVNLNEENVRSFLARYEYLHLHNITNGWLLYLDDNWTATINKKDKTKKIWNRLELAAIYNNFHQKAKDPVFQTKILNIQISKNGQSAVVETEEIMNTEIANKKINVHNRAYNTIALKNGYLLITKTEETEK